MWGEKYLQFPWVQKMPFWLELSREKSSKTKCKVWLYI